MVRSRFHRLVSHPLTLMLPRVLTIHNLLFHPRRRWLCPPLLPLYRHNGTLLQSASRLRYRPSGNRRCIRRHCLPFNPSTTHTHNWLPLVCETNRPNLPHALLFHKRFHAATPSTRTDRQRMAKSPHSSSPGIRSHCTGGLPTRTRTFCAVELFHFLFYFCWLLVFVLLRYYSSTKFWLCVWTLYSWVSCR